MSKNPRYDTAQVDDFMRVYFAELPNSPGQSPRVAYNRAEAQYHARHGKKRYANFESFKNCRSRFFKKKRLKNTPKPHTFAHTMPHTPADNAIHTRLGVPQDTYEKLLVDVPKAYIKHLQTATSIAALIADAGNDLLRVYCPENSDTYPKTSDEMEERAATAALIGIMIWQTHVAALSQTPAP